MRFLWSFLLLLALATCSLAAGLEIPLTVQETAGVERHQVPITTGVPFPKGVVKTTEKLQIMDAQGRFVPAQFFVANRWWEDGSVQWLHCDFAATVAPHGKAVYFLREVTQLPEFPSPIGFIPRGRDFEVITGPLRMVLGGRSNQLLDQVWVDENWGYDFNDTTKILDSGNFDLFLTSAGKVYRTSHWLQNKIEVEESNALRAVVRITGSFALEGQNEKGLDYVARITVYGGKTYFKLALTLLNRKAGAGSAPFPVEDLSFRVRLNLDKLQQNFTFGGDQQDHRGNFSEAPVASIVQETSDRYLVSGAINGNGAGKGIRPLNLGWTDLSDDHQGLAVAVKWFWQLYPKAFEVRDDGTLTVKLFPAQTPTEPFPAGAAKTHEMLFHFHGKRDFASGQVKNVLLGFQEPVYALASPTWYCRDSQAFERLAVACADSIKPEFSQLALKSDEWLVRSREAVLSLRDKVYRTGEKDQDRYGVFRFGAPTFLKEPGDQTRLNGDFCHALYLHFFRTGDLKSLAAAEESLAFDADLGIIPQALTPVSAEGLFDSYLLTGNRRFLEAARISSEQALKYSPVDVSKEMPTHAQVMMSLLKGYEVFGDRRYLDRVKWLAGLVHAWQNGDTESLRRLSPALVETWKEGFPAGYGSIAWETGSILEGLKRYQELSGDNEIFKQFQRAADWIIQNPEEWVSKKGQLLKSPTLAFAWSMGLAVVCQHTQDPKYWDRAIDLFRAGMETTEPINQTEPFGLFFRNSQRFIWHLSKDFQAPRKRDVSLLRISNYGTNPLFFQGLQGGPGKGGTI